MLLHKSTLAAGVCCILATTLLSAQDSARGPAARGRVGRQDASNSLPRDLASPSPSSRVALTNARKVQAELGLSPEQKQKVARLRASTADKQRELYEEFRKRISELDQQTEEAVAKVLDEKQCARLEQIRLQREGTTALTLPDVAEKLELTSEQREKLADLERQYRQISPFGFGPATNPLLANIPTIPAVADFPAAAKRARENREKIAAEMIGLLTPEQKAKWDDMQGVKFEFYDPQIDGGVGGAAAAAIQIRTRSRAFELGQNTTDGRANPAAMRYLSINGPAGPFRYQTVVEVLELSKEQKTMIQAIGAEDSMAVGEVISAQEPDPSVKIEQINKATQEKLDNVLTDEQKSRLKDLLTRQRNPSN
jgi:hypothetical protein